MNSLIHEINRPEFKGHFINFAQVDKQFAAHKANNGEGKILEIPHLDNEAELTAAHAVHGERDPKHMSFDAFTKYVKKRKGIIKLELLRLMTYKNPSYDVKHKIEVLQQRLRYLEDHVKDIKLLEKESEAMIHQMQLQLEEKLREIEDVEDTKLERWKRNIFEKLPLLQPKMKAPKLTEEEKLQKELYSLLPSPDVPYAIAITIPPPGPDELPRIPTQLMYSKQAESILAGYFFEIKMKENLFTLLFGIKDEEEEEALAKKDIVIPPKNIDDLLLACDTGDYRKMIKLLDSRENDEAMYDPALHCTVSIHAKSFDGMTALYSVLSKILQQDFASPTNSRQAELVQNLFATDWQIFYRKYFVSNKQRLQAAKAFVRNLQLNKTIPLLLYYGADINYCRTSNSNDGHSILHCTVQTNQFGYLRWLIDHGADVNQLTSILHATPLMLAVQANQMEMVRFLLNPENSRSILMINHADEEGNTVLHYAAQHKSHVLMVEMLLLCGVSKNIRNKAGYLASEIARIRSNNEIATMIMTYRHDFDDLGNRLHYLRSQQSSSLDYEQQWLTGVGGAGNYHDILDDPLFTGDDGGGVVGGGVVMGGGEEEKEDGDDAFDQGGIGGIGGDSGRLGLLKKLQHQSQRDKKQKRLKKEDSRLTTSMKLKDQLWNAVQLNRASSSKSSLFSFFASSTFAFMGGNNASGGGGTSST